MRRNEPGVYGGLNASRVGLYGGSNAQKYIMVAMLCKIYTDSQSGLRREIRGCTKALMLLGVYAYYAGSALQA